MERAANGVERSIECANDFATDRTRNRSARTGARAVTSSVTTSAPARTARGKTRSMTQDELLRFAQHAFGNKRVVSVSLNGFGEAFVLLKTNHKEGGKIPIYQFVEFCKLCEVQTSRAFLWDLGENQIELSLDLDADTPLEVPISTKMRVLKPDG